MFDTKKLLNDIITRLEYLESREILTQHSPELAELHAKIDSLPPYVPPPDYSAVFDSIDNKIGELHKLSGETRLAVSEGIERTDRSERRIKSVVARSQAQLEEHGLTDDALDAEASEIFLIDDDGSQERELSPMRPEVENFGVKTSSVAGVDAQTLRRVRGI